MLKQLTAVVTLSSILIVGFGSADAQTKKTSTGGTQPVERVNGNNLPKHNPCPGGGIFTGSGCSNGRTPVNTGKRPAVQKKTTTCRIVTKINSDGTTGSQRVCI
jgi:hypothetical protein